MTEADFSAWFIGKNFSTDWTSRNFPIWTSLFSERRDKVLNVLEVGAWEGRSAIFFLNYFPSCKMTCVDTFGGSAEHVSNPAWAKLIPHCEQKFDANLAEFGSRVEKIKAASSVALARLAVDFRRFDLVYIDGSHHSTDVYGDVALSWPMLVPGGIAIFDDYEWPLMETEAERPKLGINAFLSGLSQQYRELHRGAQVIIEKL